MEEYAIVAMNTIMNHYNKIELLFSVFIIFNKILLYLINLIMMKPLIISFLLPIFRKASSILNISHLFYQAASTSFSIKE